MREIKFRGKTADEKIYYGDLIHLEIRNYPVSGEMTKQIVPSINGEIVEEYAQFVGRDRFGAEVYEGDTLLDELENEYTAEIYMRPETVARLVLKT